MLTLIDTTAFTLEKASRCSTTYIYKGHSVELFMICSGEPCIWLHNSRYELMSERFPVIPKYTQANWLNSESRYRHQSPIYFTTPDITPELLPGGWQTFITEVEKLINQYVIGTARRAQLSQHHFKRRFKSRRLHNKECQTYEWLELDIFRASLPVVSASDEVLKRASPWWQKAKQIFDSLPLATCWHDLTDNQFNVILEHFKTVTPKDLADN